MDKITCKVCKIDKSHTEYRLKVKIGRHCLSCRKASRKAKKLRLRHGISKEQYNSLLVSQAYSCLICKTHENSLETALCVDHSHTTGEIRGLLCSDCNVGLGRFKDNVQSLKNAVEYLISQRPEIIRLYRVRDKEFLTGISQPPIQGS